MKRGGIIKKEELVMNKNNAFSNLVLLDLTRYLPGGYATQPFADWGGQT